MNFKRYCKNELLNSVISIYKVRFETRGFSLQCNISTQEKLPCPDMALCTVLSNALENSMHALEKMTQDNKWADLKISMKGEHLLLELKNPIETIPPFVDGIPVSKRRTRYWC
ncbi:MAG: GHKL domain-containing protein [Anaerostipes hadrus]